MTRRAHNITFTLIIFNFRRRSHKCVCITDCLGAHACSHWLNLQEDCRCIKKQRISRARRHDDEHALLLLLPYCNFVTNMYVYIHINTKFVRTAQSHNFQFVGWERGELLPIYLYNGLMTLTHFSWACSANRSTKQLSFAPSLICLSFAVTLTNASVLLTVSVHMHAVTDWICRKTAVA